MRRLAPAAAAAALTALLLAGCTAGGDHSSSKEPGVAEPAAPNLDSGQTSSEGGEAADSATDTDRSVITTGWMSVTVDDPIESAEVASDIAEQAGGRIDNRS